ncbi:MAG: hypothetical protein WBV94_09650 [Blastocatellia bacterium]
MKLWTIKEIAELGIYSLSFVKRAIYIKKTLKVHRVDGSRSPRVKHSDLVKWLGADPIDDGTVEITKTIKTKDKTITATSRIDRELQPALFDLKD